MNETAATSGATGETISPDQPADKLTIHHVARTGSWALAFVREFPWVGMGVLSTCLGVLILYAYFRGIGHVPTDFATVLGAGVGLLFSSVAWDLGRDCAPGLAYLLIPAAVLVALQPGRQVVDRSPAGGRLGR